MDLCYTIKTIYNDTGLFDDAIDCAYVILCCGNRPKREDHVMRQLNVFKPCKTIKLIYNNGYRCKFKNLVKKQSDHDLLDALLYTFKDAIQYEKILVLEDDFQIDGRILDPVHYTEVSEFLKNNDVHVYGIGNMGCPYICDMFSTHQRMNMMTWAHAIFYSRYYRSNVISYTNSKQNQSNLGPNWATDRIWNEFQHITLYRYYKPLCYQLFTRTENSRNWGQSPILKEFMYSITMLKYKILGMDKSPQPGFDIIYNIPLATICIIFIVTILYSKRTYLKDVL